MALVKGTNCYVTLNEADSYFDDRMDVAAWDNADCDLKEQALITATSYLDEMDYLGKVADTSQLLAFPRAGSFRDTSRGVQDEFSSTYTFTADNDETEYSLNRDIQLIRRATYELAYHLINNDGLWDRTGSFENIKVGSIEITEVQNASLFPSSIRRFLKPILRGSGRYWRSGW